MKNMLTCVLLALVIGCATTDNAPSIAAADRPPTLVDASDQSEAITHYLSSMVYQRTGQIEEAIRELRRAADLSPGSTNLQVRLLGAYFVNEDFENAATMAERAVKYEPTNVAYQIWQGRIYHRLERYDAAMDAFRRALELDPDNAMAYEKIAEIEQETNDLVGAVGVYRQMLEIAPDSALLHYRLALNLIELGDVDGARNSFVKALELNPQFTQINFLLGVLDLEDEEFEAAIERFKTFLMANPGHARARVNMAAAYARLGDYVRAMNVLTRVIESAEVETRHHLMRTYVILRRGEEMNPALAPAPNGAPLLGTLLQALVRRSAGEPYEQQLASLDSIDGDLDFECTSYLNGIISLFGVDDAGPFLINQLQDVVTEGAQSRVLLTVLGRALMSTNRDEEAIETFSHVIEVHGSEKWIQYYLATAHENLKNPSLTERHLRECLRHDPNDPDVLNFLGYFLADRDEKLNEAEKLIDRALQMDPENGFYLDSLGWIYYRQGKGELAVEYIRRAIRAMTTDDAILRDHLGDAYLLKREIANAVAEWRRALLLDPEIEGVQDKIEKYLPRISE